MTLQLVDRIAVEVEGDGDAVVCVHGLGGSSNTFTPLMPTLARHRVVRPDMPGSARSARVEGPLSIARFVDALQSVCARLGVARAHWIGHSLGTIVCQHLAVAAPKLVRSLALFGPLAVAFVRESLMRQDADGYARTCDALADAEPAAIERIEAPVLLVTGDEDGVAPPQQVRALAEKLHGAKSTRVAVLPRCGHWTPVERPEECARELREFLAAVR
jgi:pimeloyl-ACP methyl ester carboxylesterase